MTVLMGMGQGSEANVYLAGQKAAQQMMAQLGGRPQLTLVFSSLRFADPRMLAGVRSVTDGGPLIGCTNAGAISTWGYLRQAVVVIGLRGGADVSFITAVAYGVSKGAEAAGKRLAQDLKTSKPGAPKAALIFPDGLASNGSALVKGVQEELGTQVPIVGGAAGDDLHFQRTFQYFDDAVLSDSVPGAVCSGQITVGIGVRHGWLPVGRPLRVTKSKGDVLCELDGEPAVKIYERFLGAGRRPLSKPEFLQTALTYPLAAAFPSHPEALLRNPVRVGPKGSLICAVEFPEGSWVHLMMGSHQSALEAARDAALEAVAAIGPGRFKGALVFSGASRQKILGSESQDEVDVIREILGGVGTRLGGFYGYGELGPVEKTNAFQNDSVVVMAIG